MSEIVSKIDPKSEPFLDNFRAMERSVLGLRQLVAQVKNGGGEKENDDDGSSTDSSESGSEQGSSGDAS